MARIRNEAPNERNVVVYYFTDSTKNQLVKNTTRWYRYPRAAVQAATDNLLMGMFPEARVAVVYDDYFGEDHAILVRHLDGRVEAQPLRDIHQAAVAGNSRDPMGTFIKRIAKSRQRYVAFDTPAIIRQRLGLKG